MLLDMISLYATVSILKREYNIRYSIIMYYVIFLACLSVVLSTQINNSNIVMAL